MLTRLDLSEGPVRRGRLPLSASSINITKPNPLRLADDASPPPQIPPFKRKNFMTAGFYCNNDEPDTPHKLVIKVLQRREAETVPNKGRRPATSNISSSSSHSVPDAASLKPVLPPLPYDFGYKFFFEEEHDFALPYYIQWEAENGTLDGKKKPTPFSKIRASEFIERTSTQCRTPTNLQMCSPSVSALSRPYTRSANAIPHQTAETTASTASWSISVARTARVGMHARIAV